MTTINHKIQKDTRFPNWILALLPLALLLLLVLAFFQLDPLRAFDGAFPPLEELSIQRAILPDENEIELSIINGGPDRVTVAQVLVDDAYWQFDIEPSHTISRLGTATIKLTYPWVKDEPLLINLITSTGVTFEHEVEVAIVTPEPDAGTFTNYGLLGIYVGVIPVALGMLWYPFMRRISRKWMNFVLALTLGLLVFLVLDTWLEAIEIASALPDVFQGLPVIVFSTLFSLGALIAVGRRSGLTKSPLSISALIALGIGLHNFGEGLAIGAAFATGAAALGSFLVVGFTLHNITEGVGIAAPLLRDESPGLGKFVALALLAGTPAIFGTWVGSLAFSPLLAVVFLSLGAGAILQVIWEVSKLLLESGERREQPSAFSWLNLSGLMAGILIMYLTAFLVKF